MGSPYKKPPRLAEWLLSRLSDKTVRNSALGDFEEQFQFIAAERSVSSATIWYWFQIIRSIPSFVMDSLYWNLVMLKTYLKLTFRNLVKNKMASIINLTGLSAAIGCSLVAFAFFDLHYNLDSFHENAERIFLVKNVIASKQGEQLWGNTPLPLGPALERDFPQIKRAVRWSSGGATVHHGDNVFQERVQFVDKGFLQMFTFPLKFGDIAALSDNRNVVVLSEELAIKYFGETNPVGHELAITFSDGQKTDFVVKGVAEKLPQTASFGFNMLIPYDVRPDLEPRDQEDWSLMTGATFIELNGPQGIETVANEVQRYIELRNAASPDRKMAALRFEPLQEMARNDYQTSASIGGGANPAQLFGLFFLGLFLLLLACFNCMNISVVSATRRLKEIAIRKVMGGQRSQLVGQFLGENVMLCLIALAIGLVLGQHFLVPGFRSAFGGPNIEIYLFGNTRLWIFMGAMLLLTALGSGAYPAFYISSFQPVSILRDKVKLSGNSRFTQILLTLQFGLSFILIVYCVAFVQNNTYLRNLDWGYDQEQVLVLPLSVGAQFHELKNAVAQHPNVLAVAGTATHIGRSFRPRGIEILEERYDITAFEVGYDYIEAMGLRLEAGRSFDRKKPTDLELAVIVNQSFVEMMQWQAPLGKHFKQQDTELTVIGVVKDFNYRAVGFEEVEPALLKLTEESQFRYLVAGVKPGTAVQTSEDLQQTWRTLFPDAPYSGYFQDTIWDGVKQILTGIDHTTTFLCFVVLLLTCMGILGLVSMNIAKRMKEISIRKVLGASVVGIANLINKRFVLLFGIASVLALPAGYFLTKMMLDAIFPDHRALGPEPFCVAFVAILGATLATIASQLYKALVANPVDALRNE